jgi:ParB-like chromosome segregation protein Spo0J
MSIEMDHIAVGIRQFAVEIDSIAPDPANARLHSPRNIDAIKGSLRAFRQQTPVVVDSRGIIRKGNGTWQAGKALGWTHIAAIVSDLSATELSGYAIADNRAGDPEVGSTFDNNALAATLEALRDEQGFDVTATGFTMDEVAALIASSRGDDLPADASGVALDDAALAGEVETVTCPHCGKVVPL